MNLDLIMAVAAAITTGIFVVTVLSGKKPEEFLYSNEHTDFSQYFFRPKSLILSLSYGFTTAITAFSAVQSSPLKGYEYLLSALLFAFVTFMLLVYNCWPGSAGRKVLILLFSVAAATFYWVVSFISDNVVISENLSTVLFFILFTGFLLALWIRAE